MKKSLLFLSFFLFSAGLMAQCSDLFISEYVEGYASNKALEIYNPTGSPVQLSDYSLARFSNGSTSAGSAKIVQLPTQMLPSYETFVVVLDKRDTTLWNSQLDKPVWNGYILIDTVFDIVSGMPLIDSLSGEVIMGPQYLDGNALFGSEYNEEYDLQCKADVFLNPVYNDNNVMYFNGNDAIALITGTTLANDASNLVDVIGVIGEDPDKWTDPEPGWVNANGAWLTYDKTLVRNANVKKGRNALGDVIFNSGGKFLGEEWEINRKNDFSHLGIHRSDCASGTQYDFYSCSKGPLASTYEINQVGFRMYPNPNATGALTIEAEEQIQIVEVYNVFGQKMSTTQIGGFDKVEINTNNLTKGMYLVNLFFDGNKRSVQKLVVE